MAVNKEYLHNLIVDGTVNSKGFILEGGIGQKVLLDNGTTKLISDFDVDLSNYVDKISDETINGEKDFKQLITFSQGLQILDNYSGLLGSININNKVIDIRDSANMLSTIEEGKIVLRGGQDINRRNYYYLNLSFQQTSTNRTYDFPDKSGTVALTSDLPDTSNFVNITTDQNIGGEKIFTGNPSKFKNGIDIGDILDPNKYGRILYKQGVLQFQTTSSNVLLRIDPTLKNIQFGAGTVPKLSWDGAGNVTATLPNKSGTLAMLSDISNFALLDGSNATGTWVNTSNGCAQNPVPFGKSFAKVKGNPISAYLKDATYGLMSGFLQDYDGGPDGSTGDWSNRIKMLHNNDVGYFNEISVNMTGVAGMHHRRMMDGTLENWRRVWDSGDFDIANYDTFAVTYTKFVSITDSQAINGYKQFNKPTTFLSESSYSSTSCAIVVRGTSSTNLSSIGFYNSGFCAGTLQQRIDGKFRFTNDPANAYLPVMSSQFLVDEWNGTYGPGNGIQTGNGDGASYATCNMDITSWNGVGFKSTYNGNRSIVFDVRNGTGNFQGALNVGGLGTFGVISSLSIYANGPDSGTYSAVNYTKSGSMRFMSGVSSEVAGSGNSGQNFEIHRYDNAGGWIGMPFSINRATGKVSIQNSVEADKIVKAGGTSTQVLMADGSVKDESTFSGNTSNYVTKTGTNNITDFNWKLLGLNNGLFINGAGDLALGFPDSNIGSQLAFDDEGCLLISATGPDGIEINGGAGGINVPSHILSDNYIKANSFIKNGGTSSQFLKADGTVDANTYLTSIPTATSTVVGGRKLFSDTVQNTAANAVSATASRTYGIQVNTAGQMVVNVPWTNTVYSHPNSGVAAGTYKSVTVNAQGHVTAGTNPTTIAGYGITDAIKTNSAGALNNLSGTGSTFVTASTNSIWFDYNWANTGIAGSVINFSGLTGGYNTEIFSNYSDGSYLGFRTRNGDSNNWNPARQIWHTGNHGAGSGLNADLLDGLHAESFLQKTGGSLTGALSSNSNISVVADGVANDPYGKISVIRGTASTFSYFGLTRSGNIAWQLGIDTANNFVIGTSSSTDIINNHLFKISTAGVLTASSFVKSGGTSTQVLMANGTVKELSTIGGSNYTTGSNISLTGNVISVVNSPTFSGTVTATSFYESSLSSLKTNIQQFEKSGLDLIKELDIVTFDRKDETAKNKIGIIADDSPKEFLSEELDAVDLYKTVFIQAKAIQELEQKQINSDKKIKDLEEKINMIISKL